MNQKWSKIHSMIITWWNFGIRIWPGNPTNVLPVANSIISLMIKSSVVPQKSRKLKSIVKTMLVVFFDIDRLVHHEFIPRRLSVNTEFYKKSPAMLLWHCVQTILWKMAHQQLDSALWQCPWSQVCYQKHNFNETQNSIALTPSILPWPCSMWLLDPYKL